MQLAVIGPQPQVVGEVHAHHAGLDGGLAAIFAVEPLEELPAELQGDARVLRRVRDAVLDRDGRHLEQGMAADGAGRAAVAAHGVFPGLLAQEIGCAVGAVGDAVHVVDVACDFDRRFRRAPALAGPADPAGGRIVVFGLGRGKARHHMLVVAAEDGEVEFDELLPLALVPGDAHRAAALDGHGLEVFRAHHPANAPGRVGDGIDHHAHGGLVFPGLADGRHHAVRPHLLAYLQGGAADARAPQMAGVADFHMGVADHEPHGFVGPAFDDQGVVPGVFEFGREMPAHVARPDQRAGPAGGKDGGHGGAAVARHARADQHPGGEDQLVGRLERAGPGRNFVPEHPVADSGSAEHRRVAFDRVLGSDFSRGEIHAQDLADKPAAACSHDRLLALATIIWKRPSRPGHGNPRRRRLFPGRPRTAWPPPAFRHG